MAWIRDEPPITAFGEVRYAITVAGLRELGRSIPPGLVNDVFLQAIFERSTQPAGAA